MAVAHWSRSPQMTAMERPTCYVATSGKVSLQEMERGLAEPDAGDTVSHEEALAEREQRRM
jgi:predicted transcriptional regulator